MQIQAMMRMLAARHSSRRQSKVSKTTKVVMKAKATRTAVTADRCADLQFFLNPADWLPIFWIQKVADVDPRYNNILFFNNIIVY
jgi:hypothetical protein